MKSLKYILILSILLTSCVQEAHLKTVHVSVDMNGISNPKNVGIRGSHPLSWEETTPLTDTNNDGIFEGTFSFYTASHGVQFKFVNNSQEFELNGSDNRTLKFNYEPETIRYYATFDDVASTKIKRD